MKEGDEYVNMDTGQVWRVDSFTGNQIVMRWQDTKVTIECTCEEFLKLFDDIPAGKKRACYPRTMFSEWSEIAQVLERRTTCGTEIKH